MIVDVSDHPELRDFLFSHFALLERRLDLLRTFAVRSLMTKLRSNNQVHTVSSDERKEGDEEYAVNVADDYFSTGFALQDDMYLMQCVNKFVMNVCKLFNAPRIQRPLWLNSQTFTCDAMFYSGVLADDIQSWCRASQNANVQLQHQKLLGDFVTSLLSYHLGWVFTIASKIKTSSSTATLGGAGSLNRESTTLSRRKNQIDDDRWKAPYNAHLAQLTDLFGLVGYPVRASKTIIIGSPKNKHLVCKMLRIASYFIRCGEVVEVIQKEDENETLASLMTDKKSFGIQHDPTRTMTGMPSTVVLQKLPDKTTPPPSSAQTNDVGVNHGMQHRTFGRSLLLDYSTEYCPDAVLMGLDSRFFDEQMFKQDLVTSTHLFDCSGSIGIVLDVDNMVCRIYEYDKYLETEFADTLNPLGLVPSHRTPSESGHALEPSVSLQSGIRSKNSLLSKQMTQEHQISVKIAQTSKNVMKMIQTITGLLSFIPKEMCMTYIEDHLQDLYNQVMLIKLKVQDGVSLYGPEMKSLIGYDQSDLELIKSVLTL